MCTCMGVHACMCICMGVRACMCTCMGVRVCMCTCMEARSCQEAPSIFLPPYSLRQSLSLSQTWSSQTCLVSLARQLTRDGLTQRLSCPLDIYPHVFCWRRRWDESGRQVLDFQLGFVGLSKTNTHGVIHHSFGPVCLPSALSPAHHQDK